MTPRSSSLCSEAKTLLEGKNDSVSVGAFRLRSDEGGHHGSSTNEQLALRVALSYTHLWRQLR